MGKRFTLFTGQWADLTLEEVAGLAAGWGYDGLEIAVSGEHLDAWRWDDDDYVEGRLEILRPARARLLGDLQPPHRARRSATTRSTTGTRRSCGEQVWGDGDPEGVRAARGRGDEADRPAREADGRRHRRRLHRLLDLAVRRDVPAGARRARSRPATRTSPTAGTRSSTCSTSAACGSPTRCTPPRSPTTTGRPSRTLEAIGHREAFGLNWDPSHMIWQDLDPVAFITDFADRIYHVDCKDTRMRMGGGRNGVLSSHLPWGDQHRGWDFVSTGRGDVPWEDCFRALAAIGYDGPISVEWEDAGMDRLHGAPEALEFLRRFDFEPPSAAFDAAFSGND